MKKIITVLLAFALLVSNPVLCKILFSEVSAEGTSLEFFYSKLDDFKKNKYGNNSKYVDDPVNTGGYTCFGFANEIAKHI